MSDAGTVVRRPKPGRAVVFDGVPWSQYERLLRVFAHSPKARLTYDRGRLEIMSPSLGHDFQSRDLYLIVQALTESHGLPLRHGGSVTLKHRGKKRGVEPDECFWIANAAQIAGTTTLDLRNDPPPDLVVEVDASRSSVNRLGIYAALGVPEVWRWQSPKLTFYTLSNDTPVYLEVAVSRTFQLLHPSDVEPFLAKFLTAPNVNRVLFEFREWLRLRAVAP